VTGRCPAGSGDHPGEDRGLQGGQRAEHDEEDQAPDDDAAEDVARAREQRARLAARDAIHRYWNTVHSDIASSRSARAQAKASEEASRLAQDRYEVGAATQLDLLQAQRDAYSAAVARIQSDADLANARAQLRLAAGQDLFADSSRK